MITNVLNSIMTAKRRQCTNTGKRAVFTANNLQEPFKGEGAKFLPRKLSCLSRLKIPIETDAREQSMSGNDNRQTLPPEAELACLLIMKSILTLLLSLAGTLTCKYGARIIPISVTNRAASFVPQYLSLQIAISHTGKGLALSRVVPLPTVENRYNLLVLANELAET